MIGAGMGKHMRSVWGDMCDQRRQVAATEGVAQGVRHGHVRVAWQGVQRGGIGKCNGMGRAGTCGMGEHAINVVAVCDSPGVRHGGTGA